jgi:hypothetical protein
MEVDYQRALELALPKYGLQFEREVEIPVAYDGVVVTKRWSTLAKSPWVCAVWFTRRQARNQSSDDRQTCKTFRVFRFRAFRDVS